MAVTQALTSKGICSEPSSHWVRTGEALGAPRGTNWNRARSPSDNDATGPGSGGFPPELIPGPQYRSLSQLERDVADR